MKKEIVVMIEDGGAIQIDVSAIDKVEKFSLHYPISDLRIITYQPDLLINLIGHNSYRCEILDFECIDKQIRPSIGLEEPENRWNIPNMLATYLNVEEKNWQFEEREELLKQLAECYLKIKEIGTDEWKRIEKIEIPVNKVLYEAQINGCYFNNEGIESLCAEIHKSIYDYKNRIQLELNYTDDDLETYLRLKKIKFGTLSDNEIKWLCKQNQELEPFWKIRREKRNLDCLINLSAMGKGTNICKPIYKGFASTTGRIFMRDPSIQNLRRKYRNLLRNDALLFGYRYLYVDFGQFEAGILAGLTGNKKLQKIYENDTLYEKLAAMSKLEDRDAAKVAFYCYVYGGIVSKGTESFFDLFGLKGISDKTVEESIERGYISSPFGNKRVVRSESDKKWIMNHYIQSTSSLIFKQALIDVYNVYRSNAKLLIPMHDAALYMVNSSVPTESIINVFKDAFNKWIPNSKPVVKEKNFFEE